ncbi:hypothetical protein SKAU_G00049360 [Synaphobranchus kaupii]|uniref:Fetuin B n=1 Tax=Synaphobranchus kaupii TaxID=118154 RepID=A0A9Q1J8H4_SYNKA|nr:hypothetical protein SKAU_G00049360 [Synaphobranchus kaupii]
MMLWVLLLSAGFCFQCVTGSLALVTSLTCETPAVLKGAKLALNKINADRQEGYIFTLNQVHDVRQESKEPNGVAYNLIIDVLETKCHVISKKNMQACEKFNQNSSLPNYFALLNVTAAKMQWVHGPSYFVEYIIQETVCSRETPDADKAQCKLMDCEFAHKGHCLGSHLEIEWKVSHRNGEIENRNDLFLTANCEIFEPQAAKTEEANHKREGEHTDKEQEHADDSSHKHEHLHLHPHEHHHASNHNARRDVHRDPDDFIVFQRNQELLGEEAKDCGVSVSLECTGMENEARDSLGVTYVLYRCHSVSSSPPGGVFPPPL